MNQMTRREFNQTGTTGIEAKCPLEITVDGEVRLIVMTPEQYVGQHAVPPSELAKRAADEFDSLPLDKKIQASGKMASRSRQ